jgi:sugar phosphate isomerase/epimerase
MIKSCVTVNGVTSLTEGPWVYWGAPESCLPKAAALGFDAVELFTAGPDAAGAGALADLAKRHGLAIAAVGTGAGKVLHGLTLTHPDAALRARAAGFIGGMIDFGAQLGAPAIIGSMQGPGTEGTERARMLDWIADGLAALGRRAADRGVPLILEPLNRYETRVLNRLGDAAALLDERGLANVVLLADLFHMNIEEVSIPEALRRAGRRVGHLHFADTNRRPVGLGHLDVPPIVDALREIGYTGYASAEALPYPDPDAAAAQTMRSFKRYLSGPS